MLTELYRLASQIQTDLDAATRLGFDTDDAARLRAAMTAAKRTRQLTRKLKVLVESGTDVSIVTRREGCVTVW